MQKPITIAREEYLSSIVTITNGSPLPAFVKIEVLNFVLNQLKNVAEKEYERDLATWKDANEMAEGDTKDE